MENKKSKKVWKIILMIVIIIIVLFLIHTIRNLIIIRKLSNKTSEYTASTNYHVKTIAYYEDVTTTVDFYKKDNRTVHMIEAHKKDGTISKLLGYNNGNRVDIFIDDGKTKIANLDCNAALGENGVYNLFEIERLRDIIAYSLVSRIKSVDCNDKKCYKITSDMSLQYVHNVTEEKEEVIAAFEMEKSEIYIDKDTGLNVKRITSTETVEKEYEFNNVDDSIFVEPDISQYELKK